MLPDLGFRDAVGTHTIATKEALARAGFGGAIWVETVDARLFAQARNAQRYPASRSARRGTNLLLYQASTGSQGLVEFVLQRPEKKSLYYHNITPPGFFEPYDPGAALNLARGREELKLFAEAVEVAVAASEFNAAELSELGISDVRVIPPYLPPDLETPSDRSFRSWINQTKAGIDLLFVGRVLPHKGHRRLLRVLAHLRAGVDPRARLFLVGAWGPEAYMRELFAFRSRLGIAEGVAFIGSISSARLTALYQSADVYVSMSEHEGFGLPLVEAMRFELPIVAFDAGAVAETLGGNGVLVRTTDEAVIAEVIGRVASNEDLRRSLSEGLMRRAKEIDSIPRDALHIEAIKAASKLW
jgi:glycosyltransferase involved in cell wall biosynthesis